MTNTFSAGDIVKLIERSTVQEQVRMNIGRGKNMEKENMEYKCATENKKVPIWLKSNLTLEEAAAYSGVGRNKLRQISDDDKCPFVLWVGSKRLIKREKLDEYLEQMFSI